MPPTIDRFLACTRMNVAESLRQGYDKNLHDHLRRTPTAMQHGSVSSAGGGLGNGSGAPAAWAPGSPTAGCPSPQ